MTNDKENKNCELWNLCCKKEVDICSVERVIMAGADVNFSCAFGITPIMFAAYNGNDDLIKLLELKGADINSKVKASVCYDFHTDGGQCYEFEEDQIPLDISIDQNQSINSDASNILINLGSNIDNSTYSQLLLACERGDMSVLINLIQNGATIPLNNKDGSNPLLMSSFHSRNIFVVERIAGLLNIEFKDKTINWAIYFVYLVQIMERLDSGENYSPFKSNLYMEKFFFKNIKELSLSFNFSEHQKQEIEKRISRFHDAELANDLKSYFI